MEWVVAFVSTVAAFFLGQWRGVTIGELRELKAHIACHQSGGTKHAGAAARTEKQGGAA